MGNNPKPKYVPRGKTICPHVNLKCAKAVHKYLSYYTGVSDTKPTDDDCDIVESFAKNLSMDIKWEEERKNKREMRKKEAELARLMKEQKKDMDETGHGAEDDG